MGHIESERSLVTALMRPLNMQRSSKYTRYILYTLIQKRIFINIVVIEN